MTAQSWSLLAAFLVVLLATVKPLGLYMAKLMEAPRWQPLARLENGLFRLCGIKDEMNWYQYALAVLVFSLVGFIVVYALQRLQLWLPLNPRRMPNVTPDSSFNTAVSFMTNTNWQGYGGEATMSYLTQMLALAVQNFLSAATGIAVAFALIRGFARHSMQTIGNLWADLYRSTAYLLLPLSFVFALVLVSQGVIQSFSAYQEVTTLEPTIYEAPKLDAAGQPVKDAAGQPVNETLTTTKQTLPMGPIASQEAIKELGTNGGGFLNANSAHPYENPTPLSNFLEMLAIFLIPAGLVYAFGRAAGETRQGWTVLAAMTVIFIGAAIAAMTFEQQGNPLLAKLGVDQTAGALQSGGNMEGKETRFGIGASGLFATITTSASCGAVNSMHDSFTPLGGLVPMWMIQLGEVVFGGVGSGLYGMLLYAVMAVFVAGLMIGRTPEYLGKKIEAFDMKMVSIGILMTPALVLLGTAIAVMASGARNPHVFQHTLRLLVPSLGLAPAGLALRFAPGETLLRSGGTRPPFARDGFFTNSEVTTMVRKKLSMFDPTLVTPALVGAFRKLDPRVQLKNPVMFVVFIGSLFTTGLWVQALGEQGEAPAWFIGVTTLWLWFTVLFANFAEALAEGRSKAQAAALRHAKKFVVAKKLREPRHGATVDLLPGTELGRGHLVLVEAGDMIPADGEVIEGAASVNEAAITGESAPVIREAGGDFSAVTGGTTVLSDWIVVRITVNPGEAFIDRMIALVEGAKRQKTPNEIALTILLVALTLIFLLATVTLLPYSLFSVEAAKAGQPVTLTALVALLVCLIPTTIGALLSAIGIAGMSRMLGANVIATSGRAVEAAGDVDVLLLDKTGTITLGNRQAAAFLPARGVTEQQLADTAQLASLADETPEGRSIVVLAKQRFNLRERDIRALGATFVPFSAQTRMSGVNLEGRQFRKGAADAIRRHVETNGGSFPDEVLHLVEDVARRGSTPLVVAGGTRVLGVIELKDIVKGGIKERFAELPAPASRP